MSQKDGSGQSHQNEPSPEPMPGTPEPIRKIENETAEFLSRDEAKVEAIERQLDEAREGAPTNIAHAKDEE